MHKHETLLAPLRHLLLFGMPDPPQATPLSSHTHAPPCLPLLTVPGIFPYRSAVSNWDYTMVNSPMSYPEAQNMCVSLGGHLAYFTSLDEQTDVEAYYTGKGYLLEEYHQAYWMGLRADGFPAFRCAGAAVCAEVAAGSACCWDGCMLLQAMHAAQC
jgi:hypothetical protein